MMHFYVETDPPEVPFLPVAGGSVPQADQETHATLQHSSLRKTVFLSHFYIKTIVLPRQARDKHRENTKKDAVFLTVYLDRWPHFGSANKRQQTKTNEFSIFSVASCV
jgi:hypothetical protein